jgi:hypothetical protein
MPRNTIIRFSALGIAIAATGCTLDVDKYRQSMAEYAIKPYNKSYFMNTTNYGYWMSWGQKTPDAAIDAARAGCEKNTSGHCVPVALNDRQLYDPVPGALEKQESDAQAESALIQMLGTLHK